jgi:hypothetical protein
MWQKGDDVNRHTLNLNVVLQGDCFVTSCQMKKKRKSVRKEGNVIIDSNIKKML